MATKKSPKRVPKNVSEAFVQIVLRKIRELQTQYGFKVGRGCPTNAVGRGEGVNRKYGEFLILVNLVENDFRVVAEKYQYHLGDYEMAVTTVEYHSPDGVKTYRSSVVGFDLYIPGRDQESPEQSIACLKVEVSKYLKARQGVAFGLTQDTVKLMELVECAEKYLKNPVRRSPNC